MYFLMWSLAVSINGSVYAQQPSASRLTPPSFKPSAVSSPSKEINIRNSDSSRLVSNLSVKISGTKLDGAFKEVEPETNGLLKEFASRRRTVTEIFQLAATIEKVYARQGYVFARVVVPPQSLKDGGTLRLRVVDGVINQIDAQGIPIQLREIAISRLRTLVNRKHLKISDLERGLLLAADIPGLSIKSALTAGDQQGTTKLIVEGKYSQFNAAASISNDIPYDAGGWRRSFSINENSKLGIGEQAYFSLSSSILDPVPFSKQSQFTSLGIGFQSPVGNDGLSFNPEYSLTKTNLTFDNVQPDVHQSFERAAFRFAYPIERLRTGNLNLGMALEHIEESNSITSGLIPVSEDEYWAYRFSIRKQFSVNQNMIDALINQSFGLGGRKATDATVNTIPLSRFGSGPYFKKIDGQVHMYGPINDNYNFDVYSGFQYSFGTPLMQSEQFSLDGPTAISGFDIGSLAVDTGFYARLEISRRIVFNRDVKNFILTPYIAVGSGWGLRTQPTSVEQREIFAQSLSAGLKTEILSNNSADGLKSGIEIGIGHLSQTNNFSWRITASLEARF